MAIYYVDKEDAIQTISSEHMGGTQGLYNSSDTSITR